MFSSSSGDSHQSLLFSSQNHYEFFHLERWCQCRNFPHQTFCFQIYLFWKYLKIDIVYNNLLINSYPGFFVNRKNFWFLCLSVVACGFFLYSQISLKVIYYLFFANIHKIFLYFILILFFFNWGHIIPYYFTPEISW